MESQRTNVSKVKSSDGLISPINVPNSRGDRRFHQPQKSSLFDPYASDSSESPSPLVRYLRSTTPAIGNMPPSSLFNASNKVEEDVLVMDGIPVPKSNDGSRARMRPTPTSLNFHSASSLLSRSWGNETANPIKTEHGRRWEDSGTCRFGSKCQFAHGKEELRPPRFSSKYQLEVFKMNTCSCESNSSSLCRKCSVNQNPTTNNTATATATMTPSTSTVTLKSNPFSIINYSIPKTYNNWSPLHDGIQVTIPSCSTNSSEDVDAYIHNVLYGTSKKSRLPVFTMFAPTD